MHRAAPITKNRLVQNVSGAKVEILDLQDKKDLVAKERHSRREKGVFWKT